MANGNDKVVTLHSMTLREALMKSLLEGKDAQSDYFDECYARLLQVKADIARCTAVRHSDRQLAKLQDVESEALWDVIHALGVHRWQIAHKLELLEELLNMGHSWFDRREFFMIASVRMDLECSEPLRVLNGAHK